MKKIKGQLTVSEGLWIFIESQLPKNSLVQLGKISNIELKNDELVITSKEGHQESLDPVSFYLWLGEYSGLNKLALNIIFTLVQFNSSDSSLSVSFESE